MDIKKLQTLVVDALEDVKAQDIAVFDTTHLTSLFDRVAIASGTSNRQTKALAASVRDKVKDNGGHIVGMEGQDTGEWVLVDLGRGCSGAEKSSTPFDRQSGQHRRDAKKACRSQTRHPRLSNHST
jgi:ribosome silencing factor RsfS/YbeB/iojap